MGDVLDGYINKICMVWVEYCGHRVTWVLGGADSLKKRLLVCTHLEGSGHRGSTQRWFGLSSTACGIAARLCRISR